MEKRRYPARHFRLWLKSMTTKTGRPISKSEAARLLGCGRNSILDWEQNGAPFYIGLACRTLWDSKREGRTLRQSLPDIPEEERLKGIRWTKIRA
jgi:hypothetical protein